MPIRYRLLFVAFIAWSMTACTPVRIQTTPTPPAQPAVVTFDTVTCDGEATADGRCEHPVANATVTVDDKPPLVAKSNTDGYVLWTVPSSLVDTFITVDADGFEHFAWGTIHPKDLAKGHNVLALKRLLPDLPRLQANGEFLVAGGQPFYAAEASLFHGYQQFLDGGAAAVEPQLVQLEQLGFNMVRVFGMYWNDPANGGIGFFRPQDYGPRYFDKLPEFYTLLSKHHLYGEFTAFADATVAMPSAGDQLAHWHGLVAALQPLSNALLEAVNEVDQPVNELAALYDLPRPTGLLASHGSNGSQAWPISDAWDYMDFHTNDADEEQRKVGHNAMEVADAYHLPVITNETSRAPFKTNWTHGGVIFGHDLAAGSKLLNAGACFHSDAGKTGTLLSDVEVAYARAFIEGVGDVPISCQAGPYQRLDPAGYLRIYQRGTDGACLVKIR